jgi:flagellin
VTKTDADRTLYNSEFRTLAHDILSFTSQSFNGVSLFSTNSLQVTTDDAANTFTMAGINLGGISYANVLNDTVHIIGGPSTGAVFAMNDLKRVVVAQASARASIGTNLQSLTYYHDQTAALKNNLSAANSRITDVDVAQESAVYAKYNILTQAGTAMLAQANSLPQSVLKLLG